MEELRRCRCFITILFSLHRITGNERSIFVLPNLPSQTDYLQSLTIYPRTSATADIWIVDILTNQTLTECTLTDESYFQIENANCSIPTYRNGMALVSVDIMTVIVRFDNTSLQLPEMGEMERQYVFTSGTSRKTLTMWPRFYVYPSVPSMSLEICQKRYQSDSRTPTANQKRNCSNILLNNFEGVTLENDISLQGMNLSADSAFGVLALHSHNNYSHIINDSRYLPATKLTDKILDDRNDIKGNYSFSSANQLKIGGTYWTLNSTTVETTTRLPNENSTLYHINITTETTPDQQNNTISTANRYQNSPKFAAESSDNSTNHGEPYTNSRLATVLVNRENMLKKDTTVKSETVAMTSSSVTETVIRHMSTNTRSFSVDNMNDTDETEIAAYSTEIDAYHNPDANKFNPKLDNNDLDKQVYTSDEEAHSNNVLAIVTSLCSALVLVVIVILMSFVVEFFTSRRKQRRNTRIRPY